MCVKPEIKIPDVKPEVLIPENTCRWIYVKYERNPRIFWSKNRVGRMLVLSDVIWWARNQSWRTDTGCGHVIAFSLDTWQRRSSNGYTYALYGVKYNMTGLVRILPYIKVNGIYPCWRPITGSWHEITYISARHLWYTTNPNMDCIRTSLVMLLNPKK